MPQPVKLPVSNTNNAAHKATDNAWKKELAHTITSATELLTKLGLTECIDTTDIQPDFRCKVTASYLQKIQPGKRDDPLLLQVLPLRQETDAALQSPGKADPVGDIDALVTKGLLHKYHGRALLISTGACAIHCRYCFRRSFPYQEESCTSSALEAALYYLRQHDEIEEIILSGGDPLTLDNSKLGSLLSKLAEIEHLQTLRIHSRLPVVLPSRINPGLLQLLRSSRFNVVMVIHSNHANELQQEEQEKLQQLHDCGVQLLNQSVLLRGINDTPEALIALSKRLFECKTLPYYLHLLDPVIGAMHFDVSKPVALEIMQQMERQLPGYLLPRLVQEIPGNRAKSAIFSI